MEDGPTKTRALDNLPPYQPLDNFEKDQLPTVKEVIRHFKHLQKFENPRSNLTVAEISAMIMRKVSNLWKLANLPTVCETRILSLIKGLQKQYTTLLKPYKQRIADKRYMVNYKAQLAQFDKIAL